MKVQDLIGVFNIIGSNQSEEENTYKGTLSLTLDTHSRVIALWKINNTQEQTGIGFFKNNILVINFKYLGYNNTLYKGTVVYQCLTSEILDGFWSEEQGNSQFLGEERCFKITTNKKNIC